MYVVVLPSGGLIFALPGIILELVWLIVTPPGKILDAQAFSLKSWETLWFVQDLPPKFVGFAAIMTVKVFLLLCSQGFRQSIPSDIQI